MRVTTLKASADRLGGVLAYYAGLADDRARSGTPGRGPVDYYLDPDEPAGRWWGAGCDAVGVSGAVEGSDLQALLEGRHPGSGYRLGRRFGDRSARAFDATFSAPKSVSVLWALTPDPWVRAEVLAAHDAAVDAALAWFQSHGAVTRRGKDGIDQVDTRGVIAALFRQHTSRTADPQLHTHAVISAKVQDPTGRWLSLDARFLKQQQRSIGWVYDAALRADLTRRLHLAWHPLADGAGQSDLLCVPAEISELFSERSAQVDTKLADLITRWVDEHDGAQPDPRTIATLQRTAVLASRPAKQHGTDAHELRARWQDQAAIAGFEPSALTSGPARPSPVPFDRERAVTTALGRVAGEASTWLPADLSRHLATLVPPSATTSAMELTALVDALTEDAVDRCLELHPPAAAGDPARRDGRPISEAVTDRHLTTSGVWQQEARLLTWARRAVGTPATEDERDPVQAAVGAIAGSAALTLIVGPAGAGKTTALAVGINDLLAAGRPVVGIAPSGKAADVLAREAGCTTMTLAKLLTHSHRGGRTLPAGTTVVLDEAGMAATDDLDHLVRLARTHRWRLVCVGDPEQLPAVSRGGMFAHWCETLPSHRLLEVRRFVEPWQADASLALRNGDRQAARAYADTHRVHTAHPALLPTQIAQAYVRRAEHGEDVAITTATASTARAINIAIQERLRPRRPDAASSLADGTQAHVGDRIATRRNDHTLLTDSGTQVRNRHVWTVTSVHDDGGLRVTDAQCGTVTLPAHYVQRHVELGWAVTGYGNQGTTTDHGIAVIEPSSTRAGIYVAMTRGRHRNVAWIADPTGLADPEDALAQAIARPANALTAHAVRARLHDDRPDSIDHQLPTDPPLDLNTAAGLIQARLDRLQRPTSAPGIDR